MADLTDFVQNLLQQMVSRDIRRITRRARAPNDCRASLSSKAALLTRFPLSLPLSLCLSLSSASGRSAQQQTRFQQMSDSIIGRIDEMGSRIDDLEKSIGDLIQQAGLEEVDMGSKPPAKA